MKWFGRQKWYCKLPIAAVLFAVFLLALNFVLQHGVAHLTKPYRPEGQPTDLRPILAELPLEADDYALLFAETGLGSAAIDDYLTRGEVGVELILATQEGFWNPPDDRCLPLIPTTMEHRLYTEDGELAAAVPIAPLRDGDILVSFSTHTAGIPHGHAGIVIDAAARLTLESVSKGNFASVLSVDHWNTYSTFLLLRPRDLTDAQLRTVVDFAKEHLDGAPYNLLVGLWGEKYLELSEELAVHCSYLPWYAYMQIGVDLDAGGGRMVTVQDLSRSPHLEVVQVFGVNPADY